MSQYIFDQFVKKYGRLPTEVDPDYLEMLNMSKYRIIDVPDFKPGKCANCGASKNDGRQYIDFGQEIDWYGIIFFCGFCIKDIAINFGLFNQFEQEIESLKAKLTNGGFLLEKGDELEERFLLIFKEVKEYFDSLRALRDESVTSSGSDSRTDETSGEPVPDKAESGTIKSTTSSRRTNVPSLAKLLESAEGK